MNAIDLHAHLVPRDVLRRWGMIRDAERGETQSGVAIRIGAQWLKVPDALLDPEALFRGDEAEGIGARVVSLPPFLLRYDLPEEDGVAYSRAMNEGLAALAAGSGGRVQVLASVPLQSPRAAADELARAMQELGCAGAEIATNVAGRAELDDPRLEPFWRSAASLRAIVLVHPHDVAGAGRMHAYHLRNLIGNPLETALAAARLLFSGVLERHPDLRVVLSHGGGALPWLVGRLERGFQVRPECRDGGERPGVLARRFYYDTVVHNADALRALVGWMGSSQVVLGTDFPFDMGDPRAVRAVQAAVEERAARRAILVDNAQRLLDRGERLTSG
ncbi:MAG TPA: amidohydrolase family protein [bacterium]|nr:amidohydrolase family protein [bacterium]